MAKEAKSVRAAALSVGIFMMTGVAGAATAISGATPYFGFTDTLFNGSLFSGTSLNEAPSAQAAVSGSPDVQTPRPVSKNNLSNLRNRVFESLERVRRQVSSCAGESGIVSQAGMAADAIPAGTLCVPDPGSWILASTGMGLLPFVRPRRLGPVPFE